MTTTPWLFSSRHNYEEVLVEQLAQAAGEDPLVVTQLRSGLVQVDGIPAGQSPSSWDPTYALQVMPEAHRVTGRSVNALARAVVDVIAGPIDGVDAAWDLHVFVPAQLRGNPHPPMARRRDLLLAAISERMMAVRRRAWRLRVAGCGLPSRLVQVLLFDEETCWVSVGACSATEVGGTWPIGVVAGLADIADDDGAPASSYRKLEEALVCMQRWPQQGQSAVDLGACPGGWTRVLRRNGARVDAIDRQPVVRHLMKDRKVHFHKADAFTWRPDRPVNWMVSDVVAYPDRILDLVDVWAGERLATNVVVQMKFRGPPDHDKIAAGLARFRAAGYGARARHFFNDKHEITLMATRS